MRQYADDTVQKLINSAIGQDDDNPILFEKWDYYGLPVFTDGGQQYAYAADDDEADQACAQYIEQSLWAFRPDFLASETDLPSEVFEILARQCESGNDAILKIVERTCSLDSLVESAIGADGRGHFLSSYDGDEIELDNGNGYLYRIN